MRLNMDHAQPGVNLEGANPNVLQCQNLKVAMGMIEDRLCFEQKRQRALWV